MSNVADLELCKELYELTGWDDSYLRWVPDLDKPINADEAAANNYSEDKSHPSLPAYDCGYLLNKMPSSIQVVKSSEAKKRYRNDRYIARKNLGSRGVDMKLRNKLYAVSDTPENALCELAIELAKQGLLERDDE